MRLGATRFAINYITLDSILKMIIDLKKVFISNDGHLTSLTGHKLDMRLKGSCLIMDIRRRWRS